MKNVTLKLDEKLVAWAGQQAACRSMSLSRFVNKVLEKAMRGPGEYERAMRQYLSRTSTALKCRSAGYPSRDELYGSRGRRARD